MDEPEAPRARGASQRLRVSRPVLLSLLLLPLGLLFTARKSIAGVMYWEQDWPVPLVFVATFLALTFRVPSWRLPEVTLRWRHVTAGAFLLALLLWWGTHALMADYALTRDEHMVLFDMAVFARGHLLEPLAPEWRPFAEMVVPAFLLDVPGHAALASSYLPGNAMLRLAFSKVADPALMNPLLLGVGALALFDIAKRHLGDDRRALLVTMALYLLSAQNLTNAMTVFAMTGHTALNMVWLALFLRGRAWQHAIAMMISVVAVGLHQLVFHPLFVGPFLLWLLSQRRWRLFATYTAVLGFACLFWMTYPALVIRLSGIAAAGGASDGAFFMRDRVLPLLMERDPFTGLWMILNLLRFIAWQHAALIPVLLAAIPLIRRNAGIALPLAGGIAVTLAFFTFVLPNQGHAWGYRYFAGLAGNFALLGGLGYRRWSQPDRSMADGVFVALTAVTFAVMAYLMVRTHQFVMSYVALDRLVAAAPADFVLVDSDEPSSAVDQVRNQPDLGNRPLRLSSREATRTALLDLCLRGTIALVTRRDMHRVGFALDNPDRSPLFEWKVAPLAGKPCLVTPVPAALPSARR